MSKKHALARKDEEDDELPETEEKPKKRKAKKAAHERDEQPRPEKRSARPMTIGGVIAKTGGKRPEVGSVFYKTSKTPSRFEKSHARARDN